MTGEPTIAALKEVARRYGTPTYAYDLALVKSQIDRVKRAIPSAVDLLYSLKANPLLGICEVMAARGLGVDVSSAGELKTASSAGIPEHRITISAPYKAEETLSLLEGMPDALISVDSVSEFQVLAERGYPYRALLRLRPDFDTSAVVCTGKDSRYGILSDELDAVKAIQRQSAMKVEGFHVFCGSQVLDTDTAITHLEGGWSLCERASRMLGTQPRICNLGGGFGVPYGPEDAGLALDQLGSALESIVSRARGAQIVIELGRFLIAQAGWYLTTVMGAQRFQNRAAVVVDGGSHQRADLCRLGLRQNTFPPVVLSRKATDRTPTAVLGCLTDPHDILAESCPLPPLTRGDVLAFPNAGAYGLTASPFHFLGHPSPVEVAFEGSAFTLMRERGKATATLEGQHRLQAAY